MGHSIYASILSADDHDKDKFYAELQLLTSLSKNDMDIIEGDWNVCFDHDAATTNSMIEKIRYRGQMRQWRTPSLLCRALC
ncbi:unnamed protein product [Dracunculus medinensis]|uniref:Endo/exonuclease/phosphatase domain-containing protein n=1 Tax=Dracunculus medinensis TaxID=318479 RepID=A0A0N4UQ75_DRAME|nr:unnamed protein product [Dracunculus medinensis]